MHGGYFNVSDHIFPLRFINRNLYVPLPLIGSLYPIMRNNGISSHDVSGSKYSELIERFDNVFENNPPLVYAAGHEHNIQVIQTDNYLNVV